MEGTGEDVDIGEGAGQRWLSSKAMVVSVRALRTSPTQRAERKSAVRDMGWDRIWMAATAQ